MNNMLRLVTNEKHKNELSVSYKGIRQPGAIIMHIPSSLKNLISIIYENIQF